MRTRTPLLAVVAGLTLALAPAADAATPFTAGTGDGLDLAVGSDGTGHLAWVVDAADDRISYCRIPAGGGACDSESTFLDFSGLTSSAPSPQVQVFTPAAGKVVILATCTQCPSGDPAYKTFRFISTNNGVSFDAGIQVGSIQLSGQASYINSGDVALSVFGATFQGQAGPSPGSTTTLSLGQSGAVYGASTAVASATRAVYAVNDLDTVQYRVFSDPGTAGITAAELNANTMGVPTNWSAVKFLSAPEGNNDETMLDSGPSGVYLTYRYGETSNPQVRLRKFDIGTGTFGAATSIDGPDDAIDNNGIGMTNHSQDASGRLHVIWRSLFSGNRLRYTRSDTSGANFSAPANLAANETFSEPVVEAGPDGNGFAAWRSGTTIRAVRIDPQPEPGGGGPGPGGGGPDTTPPTAGSPRIGDSTLTPGQGTTFTFTTSENGVATLTVQKQVKGMKVKVRGKRKCVPQTRKRLRALRRRAGSPAAFRRALRRSRCKAYKRIGSITQRVTAGENTIVFNGRIAGRKLRPGRYRALLVIRDLAGNVSRTERVRFRVLRPRRP